MIMIIAKNVILGTLIVGGVAFGQPADTNATPATPAKTQSIQTDISEEQLVNLAGRQRMLSQRMARDYFYVGKKVNTSNARRQLKKSLADFKKMQEFLNDTIEDKEIKNLIAFVNMSLDEFISISNKPYSAENGALIVDLSESILEGYNYIVNALTKGKATNKIIDIAGKQRMLSQRIGKYYIAYQAGIKDKNTIVQMKESVKEFDTVLSKLKSNNSKIQKELEQVNKMWNIVYKFYLNIEKGGLPIIVFSTTDDITSKMNRVVAMYVEH